MNTVRIAVIGAGGMGQGHCNTLKRVPDCVLSAICDQHAPNAEKVGREHGVPWFTDPAKLLASRLCDAVIVSTPHPIRPPIAIAAMRAGLHVMAEKPLADRVSAADRMIAMARTTGVAFAAMFQRRTEPAVIRALELVRNGAIGQVHRTLMISPYFRTQRYYASADWRGTWTGEGGGPLLNQAPHLLDLFLLLGGMPCEVYGRTATRLHDIEVEDTAEALLTYPEGGSGYLCCSTNEPSHGEKIEVAGDNGRLVLQDDRLRVFHYERPLSEFAGSHPGVWAEPKVTEASPADLPSAELGHLVMLRNFVAHIRIGEPLLVPGAEGLRSLEVANAVWLSANRRAPVRLPISRRAYDVFLRGKRAGSHGLRAVAEVQRITDPKHVR